MPKKSKKPNFFLFDIPPDLQQWEREGLAIVKIRIYSARIVRSRSAVNRARIELGLHEKRGRIRWRQYNPDDWSTEVGAQALADLCEIYLRKMGVNTNKRYAPLKRAIRREPPVDIGNVIIDAKAMQAMLHGTYRK